MFEPNDRILTGFPTSLHFCRSRKAILHREMKDLTLALELCAFALATVLVRHVSTEKNLKEYFNSEELAIEVKDLENGASEQYLVDPKALHQGIRAFKRALTVSNYDFLVLAQRESSVYILLSFHELSAVKTGWSLKFPGIYQVGNPMTSVQCT